MPDRQKFKVTRGNNVTASIPSVTIEGQITDSATGAVLVDFTGANVISFPQIMTTLTAAQRQEFVELLVDFLVRVKTGF